MAAVAAHYNDTHAQFAPGLSHKAERVVVIAAGVLAGVLATVTSGNTLFGGESSSADPPTLSGPRPEVVPTSVPHSAPSPAVAAADHSTPGRVLRVTTPTRTAAAPAPPMTVATEAQKPTAAPEPRTDPPRTDDPQAVPDESRAESNSPLADAPVSVVISPTDGVQVVAEPGGGLPPITITLP
jgi:hypothetical protein